MLFGRKKKEELHKGDVFLAKGIYLKTPMMNNGSAAVNCLLRAMIVFLLSFGTVGGFLSAFSISYHYVLVIGVYLVLAIFFAWLYTLPSFFFRDIGYVVFFALFVLLVVWLRTYANSGFYVMVNEVLEEAQRFFDLSGVREYEVTIDNSYVTVAVMAIFIGLVFVIVQNIWLSSSSGVFWTVVTTFPVLLIPIYMKQMPDVIYVIALGAGYVAAVIFKANGHFLSSPKGVAFQVKGFKKNHILYTQDSKVFRQITLRTLAIMFGIVIVCASVFPKTTFEGRFKSDWLRDNTKETIGNFVLLGFQGLYNHYASTGGMSGGKLGGVSNVRPDYQADLVVTFAPYTNEAVYLKGYTGGRYGDNQWEDIYFEESLFMEYNDREIFEEESLKAEAELLQNEWLYGNHETIGMGKMDIENVGADISYLYYPYYTKFQNYSEFNNHGALRTVQGIPLHQSRSYYYYPKVVWEEHYGEVTPKEMNISKVSDIYLEVPEKNQAIIKTECDEIGLNASMTENEIIDTVRNYFNANIPYTLKPGATPKNEDFINYFLTENRKGYCAHFASAATLIFREMGIPARYVEGYAFGLEAVLASDENLEKKYFEYYQGYSVIGESTVLEVEVTDAMAHAWVEVYVEDFGWKVVEVTPGSNEVSDEDNFWDAFTSFLGETEIGDDLAGQNLFGELNLAQYAWLVYVVISIAILLIVVIIGRILIRKLIRFYRCHVGKRQCVLVMYYADLCDMCRECNPTFNACRSHKEQLQYMNEHYGMCLSVEDLSIQIEAISYSNHQQDEQQMLQLLKTMKQIRKAIWKNSGLRQRIRLCKR